MIKHIALLGMLPILGMMFISCTSDEDVIGVVGNPQASIDKGEAIYLQAKAADEAGNQKKALKLCRKLADSYPLAPSACKARLREAQILEQQGKILESFDAYQKQITRYKGSGLYAVALQKQAEMAHAAADGKIQSTSFFLKRKVPAEKVIEMLGKVRDNAPRSNTSAKAQYTIGQLYEKEGKSKEALDAYRKLVSDQGDSSYAADALFRVGELLLEEADKGNRNQATLALAVEAFNDYLIQYPGHTKNAEARRLLSNARGREVLKSMEIAEYYDKIGKLESAKIYYREVVKNMGSGSDYEKAKQRLKELGE